MSPDLKLLVARLTLWNCANSLLASCPAFFNRIFFPPGCLSRNGVTWSRIERETTSEWTADSSSQTHIVDAAINDDPAVLVEIVTVRTEWTRFGGSCKHLFRVVTRDFLDGKLLRRRHRF